VKIREIIVERSEIDNEQELADRLQDEAEAAARIAAAERASAEKVNTDTAAKNLAASNPATMTKAEVDAMRLDAEKARAAAAAEKTTKPLAAANSATKTPLPKPAPPKASAKPAAKPPLPAPKGNHSPEQVRSVQQQLANLDIDLGKGKVDGIFGPDTQNAIRAFERLANKQPTGQITPQLIQLLANGPQIKLHSNLATAISQIEAIALKYQVESITTGDIDVISESNLKAFLMKNLKHLNESDQMAVLRIVLTEAPIVLDPTPQPTKPTTAIRPNLKRTPPGGFAISPANPKHPSQAVAKPGVLQQFGKNLVGRMTGTRAGASIAGAAATARAGATLGAKLIPGLGWGLAAFQVAQALYDTVKDQKANPPVATPDSPTIALSREDLAALSATLPIIIQFVRDTEAADKLPQDMQKRLSSALSRIERMLNIKIK
jgi:peptidoglycan hydrolase-like protein with peptidoglycan-binding domain